MIHKILLSFIHIFLLMNLFIVNAQSSSNVELLDIEKNEITKTVTTNPKIQLEAEIIIKEIDNVVKKLKPIPDKGYMIKIPLEPSHRVENKWIYALIDEVIIIIPKNEKPYLLLFDDENKSYFFTFDSKIDPLLNTLDFSL
ncbi:hypothetical protein DFO70_11064 [Cytobacillus firmus]|uniref:Group-specific protein n=2 Tax=Cytobacillus TaxID=2675230 RepID=A0A366JPF1_CYTFI|nr:MULTISPECIES: hypothetical protein [Cytobacillus]RBP89959.1 hypothetical protein DFO70_11064 [Cytobacillus firmus]TDX40407.1 hypothetical protein DFO72_10975 [Cytobacillus oceanisediminis]